ncbi:MAG TPA: CBS domain-containing protein [Polyangia bacterium]
MADTITRGNGATGTNGRAGNGPQRAAGEFIFLSQLLWHPVLAPGGVRLGKVREVVARAGEVYPPVEAIVVATRGRDPAGFRVVPWRLVTTIAPSGVTLSESRDFASLAPDRSPRELRLVEDILDRQIVDTLGAKVVRVNDLHFLRAGTEMRLVHVDVGARGLVRRLGWQRGIDGLLRLVRPGSKYLGAERFVSWKYVQPLGAQHAALHLSIPQRQLSELHPADIAEIMEDLDAAGRDALFAKLDVETAADTLEEADPKLKRELIEAVAPERAADIVEEMSPDDAADLLGDLPQAQAQEILAEMQREEAEEVKELLTYDEDSAGGLMTTDFVSLGREMSGAEALDCVRREAVEKEAVYYLYVTDVEGGLSGVLSLRELILTGADQKVAEAMHEHPVTVGPDADIEEIASTAAKYNLLAVPVVDEKHRLLGIVTVDDVLDRVMQHG